MRNDRYLSKCPSLLSGVPLSTAGDGSSGKYSVKVSSFEQLIDLPFHLTDIQPFLREFDDAVLPDEVCAVRCGSVGAPNRVVQGAGAEVIYKQQLFACKQGLYFPGDLHPTGVGLRLVHCAVLSLPHPRAIWARVRTPGMRFDDVYMDKVDNIRVGHVRVEWFVCKLVEKRHPLPVRWSGKASQHEQDRFCLEQIRKRVAYAVDILEGEVNRRVSGSEGCPQPTGAVIF